MGALISLLPRKWNIRGRAVGSDLEQNCFQFRFENEDDLQSVLANRPYHFNFWMVILQKWEPVISASFPSQIPFWIRVKGLPLHYWHDEVLLSIGKDLGRVEKHELTKTSASVKVLVDGLKGLTKETVMDFDTGEECTLTFEYERLENHCSICGSLSHLRKHCQEMSNGDHRDLAVNPRELERPHTEIAQQNNRGRMRSPQRGSRPTTNNTVNEHEFHQRLDRHGRVFGDRVATKQTRNPPPEKTSLSRESSSRAPIRPRDQHQRDVEVNSPQYVHHRDRSATRQSIPRTTYARSHLLQWREKPQQEDRGRLYQTDQQITLPPTDHTPVRENNNTKQNPQLIPSAEQVLEEVQEATNRYVNCEDPVESAARRQRVLQSEARGEVQEVVAGIVAAALAQQAPPHQPPEGETRILSNPPLLLLGPAETTTENQTRENENVGPPTRTSGRKRGRPTKFKATNSPKQLGGVSSKKMILSMVQRSPRRAARSPGTGSPKGQSKQHAPIDTAGPSTAKNAPKITLIPTIKKKKEDFQEPPPQGP